MRKLIFIFMLCCFIQSKTVFALYYTPQQLDSIHTFINAKSDDTIKVNALWSIAMDIAYKYNLPDSGLFYIQKALNIEKHFTYKKRLAFYYLKTGNIYFELKNNYQKGLEYYLLALSLYRDLNAPKQLSGCYNNIGNIYLSMASYNNDRSDYNKALEYHRMALDIRKKNNLKTDISNSMLNIGDIYLSMNNYSQAIELYQTANVQYKQWKDTNGIMLSSVSLAAAYCETGNNKKVLEYLNICQEHFTKNGKEVEDISAQALLAEINFIFGKMYFRLNDQGNALIHLKKALKQADISNAKESKQKIYLLLSQLYITKKDYLNAYNYHVKYVSLKDSLMNVRMTNNMSAMMVDFLSENNARLKQEKENQELKLKQKDLLINRRNMQMVIIVFILLIASAIFYYRYKAKQKEILNAEILKQQEIVSRSVMETEEKERSRIARDLHDGIGQQLSAIKMNVHALDKNFPTENQEQIKQIKNISELVDESIKDVRTISHNLIPSSFEQSTLDQALIHFVDVINAGEKIYIDLQIADLPGKIDRSLSITLYRIVQEAINNIIKHAQASKVTVQLIKYENELTLMIEDNGIGFDKSQKDPFSGIGLKNIYSRVAYWKGTVNIDSHPGKGTTVYIQIPFV